jgi:hypothetical protein
MELLQNMELKLKQNYKVWKYLEQINVYFWNNILEIGCIVCIDHNIFLKNCNVTWNGNKIVCDHYVMRTKL